MDLAFLFLVLILVGVSFGQRMIRQAAKTPLNEAIMEPEGRFLDPAFLSMMFSNSGILPSLGSSTMTNAFSALCTYPYIYYYYPMCMGASGSGMYPPYSPSSSPNFASPSNSYPHFSPASNGVESAGGFSPYDQSGTGSSYSPNHGHQYNPGHYMNPYAWPSAPSEPNGPGPVPSQSGGNGVEIPSGASTANNGSPLPPHPSNNPGSSPPSPAGIGLQPLMPSPFPRMKGYNPRGSPIISEIPVISAVPPEPFLRSRLPSSPSFAIHPRDASLLPMRMFGPLIDIRPQSGSALLKNESGWNETKKALKVFAQGMIRGTAKNSSEIFAELLCLTYMLFEEPEKAALIEKYLNQTVDGEKLNWSHTENNRSESFRLILQAFTNSTKTGDAECSSGYFCESARLLWITNSTSDMELLEFVSPLAGQLLERYHRNATSLISRGISLGKGRKKTCINTPCRIFLNY